jgi:hypothetical protein
LLWWCSVRLLSAAAWSIVLRRRIGDQRRPIIRAEVRCIIGVGLLAIGAAFHLSINLFVPSLEDRDEVESIIHTGIGSENYFSSELLVGQVKAVM